MKFLVIGAGGREHAIVWKLARSPKTEVVFTKVQAAAGMEKALFTKADLTTNEEIAEFALKEKVDIVVIGPEAPLAAGLADTLQERGIKVFGPVKDGAKLESSKDYSKEFMVKYDIPTAAYKTFTSSDNAREYLKTAALPVVIKADGLAAGKGVRICQTQGEAFEAVNDFMDKKIFGGSGTKVVIEEFLKGVELSLMACADGDSYVLLPSSRDHKRLLEGNNGPNTGGMGAFSPVKDITGDFLDLIKREVFDKVMAGLKAEGVKYCGVIYAGLMLTENGPKTLEFNCRFGDPETQVVLPMLKTDLAEVLEAAVNGNLKDIKIEQNDGACVCVILASEGYPGTAKTGLTITGLDKTENTVFHAGTMIADGVVYNAGGRVLGVTARGKDINDAREKAYSDVEKIHFDGMQYRNDIGKGI